MSNVLPRDVQKEVWSYYKSRFVFVGGVTASMLAGAAFLSLMPAYIAAQTPEVPQASGNIPADIDAEKADILRTKMILKALAGVSGESKAFEALKKALAARPEGVSIQKIALEKKGEAHNITLSGTASDRTRVSAYRTALSDISEFETITVPVGALAGSDGGQFSIDIRGTF